MTKSVRTNPVPGQHCASFRAAHTLLLAGLIFSASVISLPASAGSSYLDAMNNEGERLEVVVGKARREEETLRKMQQQAGAAAPAQAASAPQRVSAADLKLFEDELRAQLPSSYVLYVTMEAREKEAVYREYMNAKTGGLARFLPAVSKILSLSVGNRQASR